MIVEVHLKGGNMLTVHSDRISIEEVPSATYRLRARNNTVVDVGADDVRHIKLLWDFRDCGTVGGGYTYEDDEDGELVSDERAASGRETATR